MAHNRVEGMKEMPYLAELRELDLSGNLIKRVEMISNMPCLEDLDLSHNQITKVSSNDFAPAKVLITLNLAGNPISDFSDLECLSTLEELNLSQNLKLTTLEKCPSLPQL